MTSYIPQHYYGLIPGTYGQLGLVPMPEPKTKAAVDAASQTRDVGDAVDIINRAISINELMFEAAHRLADKEVISAFVEGSLVIREFLDDAKAVLYANIGQEGAST